MIQPLRIGSGAGFSGDRIEPAFVLADEGKLDYLVLECLAERTIALAQLRKRHDPNAGYDPLLERRMEMLLPAIKANHVRVITNMGAANPVGAAERIVAIARSLRMPIKVAAVTGDDVLEHITPQTRLIDSDKPMTHFGTPISA